jgi:23S rRNA (adenine2503-C2)-methyltransferase
MKILQSIKVPTGDIFIGQGEKGKLEFLSIGDYGKEKNIKADFLGLHREINGVPHGELLPLTEKWVITISSQYGCSMGCSFCDVPKVGPGINATFKDLIEQVKTAISWHPEITKTKRLNVHFARMGEPTLNINVLYAATWLGGYLKEIGWGFHPVVSTIVPRSPLVELFLYEWLVMKNNVFNGEAGLQISVNTTDKQIREKTIPYAVPLEKVMMLLEKPLKQHGIKGRKIALNFALTNAPVDAHELFCLFDPQYFMCKITPMHKTNACIKNKLITEDGYDKYYPYKQVEEDLKSKGFDVIVFIPSKEEDESKITCGNAILSQKEGDHDKTRA